jgi:hypothetical protein
MLCLKHKLISAAFFSFISKHVLLEFLSFNNLSKANSFSPGQAPYRKLSTLVIAHLHLNYIIHKGIIWGTTQYLNH